MSIISLRKYLNQRGPSNTATSADAVQIRILAQVCEILMDEVEAYVLDGTDYAALRPGWRAAANFASAMQSDTDVAHFQQSVHAIVTERQRFERANSMRQGQEIRQILSLLNEALLTLAAGSDSSVERLKRVETSLHKTWQLNDIVAMKASLTETIRFVCEETEHTRAEAKQSLRRLDAELQKARVSTQKLPGLPGRADALALLKQHPHSLLVICVLERLKIVRSRYGAAIGDEMLTTFARRTPRGDNDSAFRWAEDAIAYIVPAECSCSEAPAPMADSLSLPFEHRVMTGGRSALLSAPIRWLPIPATAETAVQAAEEADRFASGAPC